jgi:penicillin-binding protein 1A
VPSLGLGAIAVSPLDMASAYATLAAGGVRSKPMAIRRVVLANGKVDTDAGWGRPQRTRVLSEGVAHTVTEVLEQNMLYGTGVGAYFGRPSAGKTGTTDNYADAWFCGYTPNLEATIWVGYPRAEIPMLNVHGSIVSGPGFPATIWRLFMESAIGSSKALDFPDPQQEPHFTPWRKQYSVSYAPPPATPSPTPAPAATTVEPTTTGSTTGGPPIAQN